MRFSFFLSDTVPAGCSKDNTVKRVFKGELQVSTPNAAVELLTRNLELHPDKVAYFYGEEALSYRELDRAGRRFAGLLKHEGIAPGERVVLALPDCFAFPVAFLACLLVGAVAVTAGSALTEDDLAH